MIRIRLLLHTLMHLRFQQIFYRIYYRFRKPRLRELAVPSVRDCFTAWFGLQFAQAATVDGKRFTFLGETAELNKDWNAPEFSKLWLYNLHYHDDLNAIGAKERQPLNDQLINQWIQENPPITGNGWEPYCLSLRIVNWVKWFSLRDPQQLDPNWLCSLHKQADILAQRLEYHILGNHLFANAKAMVFVGSYLSADKWLQKGLQIVDKEIAEQFLDDGAHFELSPMYHATLLWDLADLIALAQLTNLPALQQRQIAWQQCFVKGLDWLQWMVHPDGNVAFFNDAALGIAPTLADLKGYADKLDIDYKEPAIANTVTGKLLSDSGYAVFDWPEGHRLLADVARVGPDYQPGHAHADTLSFELSLFGQRLLVNSGTSQYGEDSERHRQRSTAAHNTVVVDGENSSEVWSGFRVARRAIPLGVVLEEKPEGLLLKASHTGYRRLPGRVTHQRSWAASPNCLVVTDMLAGSFKTAVAHLHFHPDVVVLDKGDGIFNLILQNKKTVVLRIENADVSLLISSWHPRFGVSIENKKLELVFNSSQLVTTFEWDSI